MERTLLSVLVVVSLLLPACGAGAGDEGALGGVGDPGKSIAESAGRADCAEADGAAADDTGVIRAVAGRNCNYVYHMMAVSGCGYENEYGNAHKSLHPEGDLQVLKDNERHLTVQGGAYQGDLNFLFMILPASLDDEIPVAEYFAALADLFATGEVARNFADYREIYDGTFATVTEVSPESHRAFYLQYRSLEAEIAEIAAVMRDNYSIYADRVWEESRAELSVAADELNRIFAERDFAGKWEEVLGRAYAHDVFYALLCNSMDNGPDCIDVSHNKDVFSATGEPEEAALRISHEFGIYILMDMLSDSQYQGYDYWGMKEGLAEYYNIIVSGGFPGWTGGEEYIDFYARLGAENPAITPEELFLQAVEFYQPSSG